MEEEHNVKEGSHHDGGTITFKKTDLWKYSTFVLAALVIVMGFVSFGGDGGVTGNVVAGHNPTAAPPKAAPPAQPSVVSADAGDSARWGSENAKVEIIEFSDFQCPFCSRAIPTLDQIKTEYSEEEVSIVYRHFPLNSIHPNAQKAAEASECVRDLGGDEAFWDYHDALFANQQALTQDNLKAWAQKEGYDIGSCLSSGKFAARVSKDASDAQAAGGRGTPYFVINGKPLSGAQPFSAFKQVIDAELA